jgi:uncharacterized protein (DUF433 family)
MMMPDLVAEFLKTVKVSGEATVLHKPGSVRLDDYPKLAYAPAQHGPGVRTEDNGTPVADIAIEYAANPSAEAIAVKFGTTSDHVADAIRYAAAVKFVTTDPES